MRSQFLSIRSQPIGNGSAVDPDPGEVPGRRSVDDRARKESAVVDERSGPYRFHYLLFSFFFTIFKIKMIEPGSLKL